MNKKTTKKRWVPGNWRNGARVEQRPAMSVGMIDEISRQLKTSEALKNPGAYV